MPFTLACWSARPVLLRAHVARMQQFGREGMTFECISRFPRSRVHCNRILRVIVGSRYRPPFVLQPSWFESRLQRVLGSCSPLLYLPIASVWLTCTKSVGSWLLSYSARGGCWSAVAVLAGCVRCSHQLRSQAIVARPDLLRLSALHHPLWQ